DTMHYKTYYESPIGRVALTSDGEAITGLWLPKHDDFESNYDESLTEADLPIFEKAIIWLDKYFSENNPKIDFALKPIETDIREQVWDDLLKIPYGETVTYGDIAKEIGIKRNKPNMSSQAVGGAVGTNPISIIIPCHRV